jgi:hypothetical protein
VDCITQSHLDIIPLAGDPNIGCSELAQKIKGWLGLLAQRKPERILLASLPGGLLDIGGQPVEPVCRTGSVKALMRSLVIVIGDPVAQSLAGVRKGGKKGLLQELLPESLPEPLDLAEGHRMVRRAADMTDPLPLEHLLEPRLPSPGGKLSTVVRKDLSRRSPLADGSLEHFQYRFGRLLPEQTVTHDVA